MAIFDLGNAIDRDNGTWVTTVGANSISSTGSSSPSSGSALLVPYSLDNLVPGERNWSIEFERTHSGNWYDDDQSDGAAILYFFPNHIDTEIVQQTGTWQYNRSTNNTSEPYVYFYFRKLTGRNLTVSAPNVTGETTTYHQNMDVSSPTTIRIEFHETVTGTDIFIYQDDVLITSVEGGDLPYSDSGYFVFHQHNYNNTSTETYESISVSEQNVTYGLTGIVKVNGVPAQREVRIHRRDTGEVLTNGYSDPVTGEYSILFTYSGACYAVILEDEGSQVYNSVVRDFVYATPI